MHPNQASPILCRTILRRRTDRRGFIRSLAAAGSVAAGASIFSPWLLRAEEEAERKEDAAVEKPEPPKEDDVRTNVATAMAQPRTATSMPGPYPGVVCEVVHGGAVSGMKADAAIVSTMLATAMTSLTGEKGAREAWSRFFTPKDRIGIKLNPIGGKLLANTHELVREIISNLTAIGVPRANILLWDRREEQLTEVGYTKDAYGGLTCIGTEYTERRDGKETWKGLDRLDERVFYEFDLEGKYDAETLPYMLNEGTKSYFTRILTDMVDKVINVPVFKNAGPSVTLCLKNMAFGSTSNTGRGHQIWNRYIAEVCAFPPVRDKTVLNIVDGLRGCYEGGPAAVDRYIWNANTIICATDPVAADRIGWEAIFAKRIKEGIAKPADWETSLQRVDKLQRAERLGLGIFEKDRITHRRVVLA